MPVLRASELLLFGLPGGAVRRKIASFVARQGRLPLDSFRGYPTLSCIGVRPRRTWIHSSREAPDYSGWRQHRDHPVPAFVPWLSKLVQQRFGFRVLSFGPVNFSKSALRCNRFRTVHLRSVLPYRQRAGVHRCGFRIAASCVINLRPTGTARRPLPVLSGLPGSFRSVRARR